VRLVDLVDDEDGFVATRGADGVVSEARGAGGGVIDEGIVAVHRQVILVEESFLCIEYLTTQEHTHVGYNMVDSVLLHILIKKICTFLLIIMMLMKKAEFNY
jgi:hypothetical protein